MIRAVKLYTKSSAFELLWQHTYCKAKTSVSHLQTSSGVKTVRNLLKCNAGGGVFLCGWQVGFCLARRRAMPSAHAELLKAPQCQSTSPLLFRATKPSDSIEMASAACCCCFFLCVRVWVPAIRLPINDHIQDPARHLTARWILPFAPLWRGRIQVPTSEAILWDGLHSVWVA